MTAWLHYINAFILLIFCQSFGNLLIVSQLFFFICFSLILKYINVNFLVLSFSCLTMITVFSQLELYYIVIHLLLYLNQSHLVPWHCSQRSMICTFYTYACSQISPKKENIHTQQLKLYNVWMHQIRLLIQMCLATEAISIPNCLCGSISEYVLTAFCQKVETALMIKSHFLLKNVPVLMIELSCAFIMMKFIH